MAVSAATKERMRLMWKDGLSVAEIARRTGVTQNTVSGIASRNRSDFFARGSPLLPRAKGGKPAGGGRRIIPSLEELLKEKK